jgi:predicted amidohydrolase YtcJ
LSIIALIFYNYYGDMNFIKSAILVIVFGSLILGCNEKQTADMILINGVVQTVDESNTVAEAIAVKDGIILAVGSTDQIESLIGEKTNVIDLNGKLITPGLIEGHGHFMGMGYGLMSLDLMGTSSYEEVVEKVKIAVEKTESGTWILGRGWHQSKWDKEPGVVVKGFPTHQMLSKVSPDNPVVLRHASGHALLANAKAMEIASVTSKTRNIKGGEIIKDQEGNPTGIFNESAMGLIGRYIPENDEETDRNAFDLASKNCLENGITSFHDAGEGEATINLFKKILDEKGFSTRLYVMLSGGNKDLLDRYFLNGPEIGLGNNFLTIRSIKLFIDGALGSRGAWLHEPYSDMPDHFGHSVSELSYLQTVSEEAIKNGFQVCTHAIGDRGNTEILDIYENVYHENPDKKDPRFRIEHAQHLLSSDIPRFASLGIIPAMQAIHMSSDRPWAIDRLGEDRIVEGAYVWQKLLKSGARIVNGTDVPVEPISPINCFYASVTRKTLEGWPPGGYEPDQKMNRVEALRSYTIDAAYGAFEENIKGSIEHGKLADFTVFSKNIMSIPEEEILSTKIDMTVVNGEILFERK